MSVSSGEAFFLYEILIFFKQGFCYWARGATADFLAVDFDDGGDFEAGTGGEGFVSGQGKFWGKGFFDDGVAEFGDDFFH